MTTQGSRGKLLEMLVEQANAVYKRRGWALIDKVPTPWTVHYDKRTGRVQRAFPQKKGTVDFVGISHGRAIAFDAKSTQTKTSFPLNNVEQHQVDYLLNHMDQGGISFFLIEFAKQKEFYFVPIGKFEEWWVSAQQGGRKSIPYDWFVMNCDRVKSGNGVVLDYIQHCNTVFKTGGEAHEKASSM